MTAPRDARAADVFDTLKARYLLLFLIIAWYWQPGSHWLQRQASDAAWYWHGLLYHYYAHTVQLLFLMGAVYVMRFRLARVLGRPVERRDVGFIAVMIVLVYCIGTVILYVTVYPLSLAFPEFVDWWLQWMYRPIVYTDEVGKLPLAPNMASLLSVCVIAPVMEELLFRGYLLNRWARKWGLWRGVWMSSIAFAIVHPVPLSAFAAGLLFALVYVRTQSLWAAMLVHGLSNLVVWLSDLQGVLADGSGYYDVRAADVGEWLWVSAAALLAVVLVVDRMLRRKGTVGPFALPVAPPQADTELPARSIAADLKRLWQRARNR